jgi:hypothetical protein
VDPEKYAGINFCAFNAGAWVLAIARCRGFDLPETQEERVVIIILFYVPDALTSEEDIWPHTELSFHANAPIKLQNLSDVKLTYHMLRFISI